MSDTTPDRALRAFRSHNSVDEPDADGTVQVTTTPFDATVGASDGDDGRIVFAVTVRVPTLSTVTEDEVADIVEDGWADTFRRRVENIGAVTAADHDLTPQVDRDGDEIIVTAGLSDLDHDRGANDAVAVVDYVEGTYVQGVIPGYNYTPPVTELIDAARAAGGG